MKVKKVRVKNLKIQNFILNQNKIMIYYSQIKTKRKNKKKLDVFKTHRNY